LYNWINVKDRLPTEEKSSAWVLVYADGAVNCMAFSNGSWEDWTYAKAHNINIADITHWQPLPDPPKD